MEKTARSMPRSPEVQSSLGQVYLELKQNRTKRWPPSTRPLSLAPTPPSGTTLRTNSPITICNLIAPSNTPSRLSTTSPLNFVTLTFERLRIDDYRRVNAISSYWDTLGWVYFRRGETNQARKFIESAWLLGPNGEVAYHLGEILEKEGKKDEAVQMYATAASVKRSYGPARDKLVEVLGDQKKADAAIKKLTGKYDVATSLDLGSLSKENGQADFAFVFAPGPKVEGVKFLGGDDKLKTLNDKLASMKYPVEFPDTTPTKLVRRGTITCKSDDCTLTLQAADEVISAE